MAYTICQRKDYRPAKLHLQIAAALERVERGDTKRLMIFVPPRHGKSMLTSEHFPPWFMGRNPAKSIVCATYAQDLANDFGRRVRNQMVDPLFKEIFPECTVADDAASIARLATLAHGNYYAVGIGAALTGRGAHVLVIDDPHKDRAEADSVLARKAAKDWYQSVAYTRLMDSGAIVVMQTRWHEDDLAGWLLREHADEDWEVLNMPADLESGEIPWPERYPAEELKKIRRMIGPREWSALYGQSPTPGGGGEFRKDWMRYYDSLPSDTGGGMNKYILVDPAGETRPENDFTTMWVIGLGADRNFYWLDCVRDRLNLTARAKMVMRLHKKWRPREVRYERYGMQGDVQAIVAEQNRENYRFDVLEVAGTKLKKEDRIRRLIPMFERASFYAPQTFFYTAHDGVPRDLVRVFLEEELGPFPAALHDDMLDALARIDEPDLPLAWPITSVEEEEDRYATAAAKQAANFSPWAA